jgi:hypothetical protein
MNKLREEIARVAYELYEKRGRGDGCHLDDWVEAEKIVRARHAAKGEAEAKPLKTVKKQKAPARMKKEKETEPEGKPPRKKTAGRKAAPKKTV